MVKVQRGTRGDERLCDTCANSTILKGGAESEEQVFCTNVPTRYPLTLRVVECNSYVERNKPDLYDMRQTAWILETKKVGKDIGFKPYKQWKADNKDDLELPGIRY